MQLGTVVFWIAVRLLVLTHPKIEARPRLPWHSTQVTWILFRLYLVMAEATTEFVLWAILVRMPFARDLIIRIRSLLGTGKVRKSFVNFVM